MKKADFFESLPDKNVMCTLCPRKCRIPESEYGFCKVRYNNNGVLYSLSYGSAAGTAIDPIEKKPLYHFLPGTKIFSLGTYGCNMDCAFCQNDHLSHIRSNQSMPRAITPEQLAQAVRESGCPSAAFTYNEPVVFSEFIYDTVKNNSDIRWVVVSNGWVEPAARKKLYSSICAANIDLKSFNPEFYRTYCGADLTGVLDTLIYLKQETEVWLEITVLIIEGLNDSAEEMHDLCRWTVKELGRDVPLHINAFHPAFRMTDHARTRPETLQRLKKTALSEGVKYVYIGNIFPEAGSDTVCPRCGSLLIQRRSRGKKECGVSEDAKCFFCGEYIAGVWV